MSTDFILIVLYAMPLLLFLAYYLRRQKKSEQAHGEAWQEAKEAGLTEPPSLHPVVDPRRCLGSRACVTVCPEKAIGIIGGKAQLINPAHCIGHGACKTACPHDAIQLVFGTAKRGIDIPQVNPNFETNVPGIFIAGELGGMGLIRKTAEQGRQAMEHIAKRTQGSFPYDVVIVGAGPAGIAASLGAMEKKLKFATVEQEESFGGTVYHYPRNKVVMTAPVQLPIVGKMNFGEVSKEKLLGFWQNVARDTGLKINAQERVTRIAVVDGGFVVTSTRTTYRARSVLLAIGRRGTPRKLGVPGEESHKVVYRLTDPEQYRGQHVLVVGGGDSALEAAAGLAEVPGTVVTLSYRSSAFARAKTKNRKRVEDAETSGRLQVLLSSEVKSVHAARVDLVHRGAPLSIRNDAVIVCAGGILPTDFLKSIGIRIETKHGTA